jgi:prolyl-tRNA editing enzyme YbaK/EbsC (Cys-tRNA(Pro) deacylase)
VKRLWPLFLLKCLTWGFLARTKISRPATDIFGRNLAASWMPPQPPLMMEDDDPSPGLIQLYETLISLQSQKWDSIRIFPSSQIPAAKIRRINSIVFNICGEAGYILAILDEDERVNITRLEQAVVSSTTNIDWDERTAILSLAPIGQLEDICGFASGTVPPLGLQPAPILTIVEKSLLETASNVLLVGGGGKRNQSTLLPVGTLLDLVPSVQLADFRNRRDNESSTKEGVPATKLSADENQFRQKPFFVVEPPDMEMAKQILNDSSGESIQPELVSLVGRISGVRQMARRLVFVDLAPPLYEVGDDDHPWRSPKTGEDMAVQLLLGKAICQRLGDQDAEMALRQLKVGQMVLIQGKTNVGTRASLTNWITKISLDIEVFDFQLLQTEADWTPRAIKPKSSTKNPRPVNSEDTAKFPFLQLRDIYPDSTLENVVLSLESLQSVQSFRDDIEEWLEANPRQPGLVGIDCEWKPHFLTDSEHQPVLLMQVCFHPIQRIYLLDLQMLLRPFLSPSEPMNELESTVSRIIGQLYKTARLIKVGFQMINDLQRLAASYPHISNFQEVSSVLEVSKLGMRVMQLSKQPKDRFATSSLSKMTERFVERTLNKEQQVSDWSLRPLSPEQIEYAALDAVVTPYIAEKLVDSIGATFTPKPQLERWENDAALAPFLKSWRFLLVDTTQNRAIRKWNAKRVVGDSYLASQSWITGENVPDLPSVPEEGDGEYTDLDGLVRVPSHSLSILEGTKEDTIEPMIGASIAKSKDRCISELLKNNEKFQEGWKLDFPQRSGYVELENAVVLFVSMPERDGRGQRRKYPNEWLEDGSVLSWFIKESDWNGISKLSQKMAKADNSNAVVLFVRRGKDEFLCCGRCRAVTLDGQDKPGRSENGGLIKLYLMLADWNKLQPNKDFQELINPEGTRAQEES